jgi:hypothetical protein
MHRFFVCNAQYHRLHDTGAGGEMPGTADKRCIQEISLLDRRVLYHLLQPHLSLAGYGFLLQQSGVPANQPLAKGIPISLILFALDYFTMLRLPAEESDVWECQDAKIRELEHGYCRRFYQLRSFHVLLFI